MPIAQENMELLLFSCEDVAPGRSYMVQKLVAFSFDNVSTEDMFTNVSQEVKLITWPVIINGFGICYMLDLSVCCPVISTE